MISTISLLALAAVLQTPPAERSLDIRVGTVAFEDFRGEFERTEKLLAELSAAHEAPLRFKLAAGTYGDVAHWLKQGLVDIAVVTPGLLVETVGGEADADVGFEPYRPGVRAQADGSRTARGPYRVHAFA